MLASTKLGMEPSTKVRVVEQENAYAKNTDLNLALNALPNANKSSGATDTQSKMASLTARYVYLFNSVYTCTSANSDINLVSSVCLFSAK